MRLDQGFQLGQRHDSVHLAQELLAPGHALFLRKLGTGKAYLIHAISTLFHDLFRKQVSSRIVQRFPKGNALSPEGFFLENEPTGSFSTDTPSARVDQF